MVSMLISVSEMIAVATQMHRYRLTACAGAGSHCDCTAAASIASTPVHARVAGPSAAGIWFHRRAVHQSSGSQRALCAAPSCPASVVVPPLRRHTFKDMPDFPQVFADTCDPDEAGLEFVFRVRFRFGLACRNIQNMPSGAVAVPCLPGFGRGRGAAAQRHHGPGSGGDWALFRPDGVLADRCALHAPGRRWHAHPDAQSRLSLGPSSRRCHAPHPCLDFRGRTPPSIIRNITCAPFPRSRSRPDRTIGSRHVIIGIGERKGDGNLIRYHAVL